MKKFDWLVIGFVLIFLALVVRNKNMILSADTIGILIIFALISILLINIIAIYGAVIWEWLIRKFTGL